MSVCQSPEMEMIACPDNIPGCLVMHTRPKEETITIKKALWDEMLEYKKKVDDLEKYYLMYNKKIEAMMFEIHSDQLEQNSFMDDVNKRIDKLEQQEGERQQAFQSQVNIENDFIERIANLEHHKNYQIDENRKESRLIEELQERIDILEDSQGYCGALERQLAHVDNILNERLEKLETHKNYQIDENRKESRHIEELEKRIDKIESHIYSSGDISAIHGVLENIHKNNEFEEHQRKILEERIEKIESEIRFLNPGSAI